MEAMVRARLPVRGPYSLFESLRLQRFGRLDPTATVERFGAMERYAKCSRTPQGPVTLVAWMTRPGPRAPEEVEAVGVVEVALYGPGQRWLEPRLREVLGLDDEAVAPVHPRLVGWRQALLETRLVHAMSLPELHAILVLQQRVTFAEAARSWRLVVETIGERAPGPLPLMIPPGPDEWRALGQPEARALGIDARRWEALGAAARQAEGVQARSRDPAALIPFAERIPGTGPWTSGLLAGLGAAHADAEVLGDVHLPHDVAAFFTDLPIGSDVLMLELLEPFRPHRFRVARLLMAHGRRRP